MRPAARTWLTWLGSTKLLVGFIFIAYPALLQSSAYAMAAAIAPFWVWGIYSMVGGGICIYARLTENRSVGAVGMGMSMWMQFMFGLSIFALTLQGVSSALTGSIQWWSSAVISLWFLRKGV